jgi:hypothetical protein
MAGAGPLTLIGETVRRYIVQSDELLTAFLESELTATIARQEKQIETLSAGLQKVAAQVETTRADRVGSGN